MKFSQYIELEETLNENGKSVEEFQKALNEGMDDDKLFEFFGINKALLSWGVKGVLANKLQNQAEKFKDDAKETARNSIQKLLTSKNKLSEQIKSIQKVDKPVPEKAWEQIGVIEKRIIKIVYDSMDKLAKLKTEQIEERINSSKKLKGSAKIALKYLWEKLLTDAKVVILTQMMEDKIIETNSTVSLLKGALGKEDDKLKAKAKEVNSKVKELKAEEGKPEDEETDDEGVKKGGEL